MNTYPHLNGSSILVTDDNPQNLQLIESMLIKHDCKVYAVKDGEAAIRSTLKVNPDIILLDVNMPGLNGYETCEIIKANPLIADIPIIYVSSMTDEADKVKGFEAGGEDYITKPIFQYELYARIDIQLANRQRQLQLTEQANEYKELVNSMMGREMRILELKSEVNRLSRELNISQPYPEAE